MTKQLLIYENAVPISAEHHKDLSVRKDDTWGFARGLHSVPLVAAEFEQACAEMPVVFAGQGDDLTPVGLLGVEVGENLFLDAGDRWRGRYVPAFLRRYPFVFATTGEARETLTLCLDTGFAGVNADGRGERLFDADGNRTEYLARMLKFASDYQAQHQMTRSFGKRLAALGILESVVANVSLPGGQSFTLRGFQRVNREKLAALPDDVVLELFRNDMLTLIHFHLASLNQMNRLLERKKSAAPPAPTHDNDQEVPA